MTTIWTLRIFILWAMVLFALPVLSLRKMETMFVTNFSISTRMQSPSYTITTADLFGDWRKEVLLESEDHSELRNYTMIFPAEFKMICPLQNRAYCFRFIRKDYLQSTLTCKVKV